MSNIEMLVRCFSPNLEQHITPQSNLGSTLNSRQAKRRKQKRKMRKKSRR